MAVDTRHPLYAVKLEDWIKLRDVYGGERSVKDKGTDYLPATGAQEADGMGTGKDGQKDYDRYRTRAVVPNFLKEAVEAMLGIMHREPARIEVPDQMRPLLDDMTNNGESAWTLLRKINEWQLLYGRLGLLAETPDGAPVGEALPFVVPYSAFSCINWDNGTFEQGTRALELVVLDESEYERRQDFSWDFEIKYRVLIRSDQVANVDDGSNNGQLPPAAGTYQAARFRDGNIDFNQGDVVTPSIGGRTLDRLPFVFVNTNDLVPAPDDPPLLGLADLVLAIYRLEADYRLCMHMIAAATTFVTTGGEVNPDARLGPGASIGLPKGATAQFVGVEDQGLEAMRTALEDDRQRATDQITRLFDDSSNLQSGRALNVRMGAKAASLHQIAMTGAEGLQRILRIIAEWIGADPEQVIVEPNMDFHEDEMEGQALLQVMQAVQMGLPLSPESIHRWLRQRDLTEMEFDEEMRLVEEWRESLMGGPGTDIADPNATQEGELTGDGDEEDDEEDGDDE